MRLPLLLLLPLIAAPLAAQEPPSNSELSRRIDLLSEELETLQFRQQPVAVESQFGLSPAASKVYASAEGISIGGYGEMLYQRYSNSAMANQWDFYRAILYVGYKFDERWVFNSEIEIEHVDQVALEMAYLDHLVCDSFNLRVGHVLVPMGWINEMHEPTTFWSANRPQVERLILPSTWHENAVGVFGEAGDFSYRSYLMTGFDASALGASLGTSGLRKARQSGSQAKAENLAWVGRLDWSGLDGLVVGGSGYFGKSDQSTVGAGPDFDTTLYELHAQYDWQALRLRGLWAAGEVEGATTLGNPGDEISGWYLEAGWDVFAGQERALTPFLRYSEYDLAADVAADRSSTIVTAGLAYQPIPQLVFKVDFQDQEHPGAAADTKVLEFSAGYIF
ncbi:MAG: hypothetical protein H8E31_13815 [Planctomycetes bacterium]|nr:hypothetical protein [Planctomycetota bacterium]